MNSFTTFIYLSSVKGEHRFHTLSRTVENVKIEFDKMLESCALKVTEICKLEKKKWSELDSLTGKCQEMIEKVQTTAKEQVGGNYFCSTVDMLSINLLMVSYRCKSLWSAQQLFIVENKLRG